MSDKRVLIVTYYWPPSGGVGVQRWMHFARNLKKSGWEPIVYTPENPQFEITDEKLKELVADIEVVTQPIWEPFSLFHKLTGSKQKENVKQGTALEKSNQSLKDKVFVWLRGNLLVPDSRVFWIRPSLKFLSGYIRKKKITKIITTGPPHSMHMIGLGLKKYDPELKWIADFRDPWSDWDILKRLKTGKLAMRWHKKMEREVLENADRVVTVSNRLAESLFQKIKRPGSFDLKMQLIMNGVDANGIGEASVENEDKFIIGYFGLLNELRNPENLWKNLEQLCSTNKKFAEKLEIRLAGVISNSIIERLKNSKELGDKINLLGFVPHEEVFAHYRHCNLLLLLLNNSDNAKWILPVKFFEYLSAYRPVLIIGPKESDLYDIIEGREFGEMFESFQLDEMRRYILSIFEKNKQIDKAEIDELLFKFSRYSQSMELSSLLSNI